MSLGWVDLERMKRVEAKANELGFKFTSGNSGWVDMGNRTNQMIYVKPKDDCLPHYSRDAQLYWGTLESIETWLEGLQFARNYDETLKLGNDKKRSAREQVERNRQLLQMVKTGKKVEGEFRFDITPYEVSVDDVDYDEIPF
jgi:hypothetical protein